jgi:hypothetical protein
MSQPSAGESLAAYSAEFEINVRLIAAGHDRGLPKEYLGSERFGGAYLCSLRVGVNGNPNNYVNRVATAQKLSLVPARGQATCWATAVWSSEDHS